MDTSYIHSHSSLFGPDFTKNLRPPTEGKLASVTAIYPRSLRSIISFIALRSQTILLDLSLRISSLRACFVAFDLDSIRYLSMSIFWLIISNVMKFVLVLFRVPAQSYFLFRLVDRSSSFTLILLFTCLDLEFLRVSLCFNRSFF